MTFLPEWLVCSQTTCSPMSQICWCICRADDATYSYTLDSGGDYMTYKITHLFPHACTQTPLYLSGTLNTLVAAETQRWRVGRLAVWVAAPLIISMISNLINLGVAPHVYWPVSREYRFAISCEIYGDDGRRREKGWDTTDGNFVPPLSHNWAHY